MTDSPRRRRRPCWTRRESTSPRPPGHLARTNHRRTRVGGTGCLGRVGRARAVWSGWQGACCLGRVGRVRAGWAGSAGHVPPGPGQQAHVLCPGCRHRPPRSGPSGQTRPRSGSSRHAPSLRATTAPAPGRGRHGTPIRSGPSGQTPPPRVVTARPRDEPPRHPPPRRPTTTPAPGPGHTARPRDQPPRRPPPVRVTTTRRLSRPPGPMDP